METILERLEARLEALMIAQKNVLTLDETAQYTGMSKSYLYKLTSSDKIPYYKPNGKAIYFDRVELEAWLLQNRNTTQDEIESQATLYVNNQKHRRA